MRWLGFFVLVTTLATGTGVLAQLPTYNVGRAPTEQEIRAHDVTVGPAGKELPPGKGTAKEGATIFAKRCAHCHGATATEGKYPALAGKDARVVRYPFATTIWDFINSAMPRSIPEIGFRDIPSLTPDEVYSLTAFVLYRNGIIQESDVLDAKSLPKVRMPHRDPHLERLAPRE